MNYTSQKKGARVAAVARKAAGAVGCGRASYEGANSLAQPSKHAAADAYYCQTREIRP